MNTSPTPKSTISISCYEEYLAQERPFTAYMLDYLKERGLVRQRVFEKAGLSTGYGYKILYGEKKTSNRDLILGLCLAAEMSLPQTQTALMLAGFSPLQENQLRDATITACITNHLFDIRAVNDHLETSHIQRLCVTHRR